MMRVLSYIAERVIPRWGALRTLGSSRLIKSSYVWFLAIPLAGRMFERLPESVTIIFHEQRLEFPLALPFRWQVLYAMALCFVIAQATYSLRCPPIIRRFASFDDFRKKHKGTLHLSDELRLLGMRAARNPTSTSGYAWEILRPKFGLGAPERADDVRISVLLDEKLQSSDAPGPFCDIFDGLRASLHSFRPAARALSSLFFGLGLLMLMWLVVDSTITVARTAFRGMDDVAQNTSLGVDQDS